MSKRKTQLLEAIVPSINSKWDKLERIMWAADIIISFDWILDINRDSPKYDKTREHAASGSEEAKYCDVAMGRQKGFIVVGGLVMW